MRKFTFLFALFLMMVGTAMADVIKSPSTTLLTTTELNAATTDVVLAIKCISASNSYWFCGNKSVNSTTDQEIIWVWEPTGDGTTHYLKKYAPTSAQGEGYLQATTYGIGARETAQKFKAVDPSFPSETPAEGTNTETGYVVRFAWEDGSKWINVQAPTGNPTYNTGYGLYTMYNVYATEDVEVTPPVTDLANLSNNKAYTLSTSRSDLVAKSDGSRIATTRDISGTFDKTNAQYQFALLKNTSGSYYLYSISASKFVNKTGDLVDSPAEPILFKAGQNTGTFVLYFDASHYVNMGGSKQLSIDNWSTADEGNSYTITPVAEFSPSEELLNSINTVDVTVNFIVDGKTYSSVPKSYTLNTAINAETFTTDLNGTYLTFASTDVETITAETSTINVTCTVETLPFVVSENYANATWYLIDMHSNDTGAADITSGAKNYIWTATTDASAYTTAEVTLPKYDTKQSAAFSDNMLWCFVGNVVDGFVIYNKAVGSEYALAKSETGNTATKLAAVGDATPFRIYKSTQITGAACFKKQGDDNYVNTQAVSGVKVLRGWTAADGGSSCRFFAPDHYLLNYAADITAGPANSLGTAQYFNTEGKFESFNSAIADANADHFNATATANLATILTDYASDGANATPNASTITDGGYYRLMNYNYKTYMTSGLDGTTNTLWGGLSAADAPGTAGTIVKITADGDNYKMSAQDLEMGQITDESARLNLTGGGLFTINNTGNKFTFMDVSTCDPAPSYPSYRAIHQTSDNRIVGWETGADATKWYVIPATTLDLPLNAVEGKSYATTYLPFDVTLPADVKAYIVTVAEGDKATVSEVGDIPANQGVVLVSETAASTATLTLGTASANCASNILSGTNPRITIEESAKNDYYIFGNGGNGVGFYHPNSTTLKENRAYLPASAVSGGGMALALDFGGINTGIEAAIQTDEANAAYYDLSGRRVMRPTKGIYVKNGRKVYVK
ncbi:MAG: hypothetical protein PUF27_07800 [Bacteroidales bacterium]|nr:hypothetical protein [Bacteroidales bacterium]MDD6537871.1 hypothetical protein [Bacteroidales bacterium]MDD6555501.1 hypothetical protein [Bacteroidales bacterium]